MTDTPTQALPPKAPQAGPTVPGTVRRAVPGSAAAALVIAASHFAALSAFDPRILLVLLVIVVLASSGGLFAGLAATAVSALGLALRGLLSGDTVVADWQSLGLLTIAGAGIAVLGNACGERGSTRWRAIARCSPARRISPRSSTRCRMR